jgi:hypothetical protein
VGNDNIHSISDDPWDTFGNGIGNHSGYRNRFWNPASGIDGNFIGSGGFLPYRFDMGTFTFDFRVIRV